MLKELKERTKGMLHTRLAFVLCTLLLLVAACGTNNSTTSPKSIPTLPPGENIYILDGYTPLGATASGNQQIVAFHPGSAAPGALLTLPAGLTSGDHQRLYTAFPQNGRTTITIFNTQTGATIRSFNIPGTYATNSQDFSHSVLSYDGQWLALRQAGQRGNHTTIALVDTRAARLVKTILLHGDYDLDALNPEGNRIYVLEKLNDNYGHYYVKLYHVDENKLDEYPIVDKTIPNDIMTGEALARQMLSDGKVAYTLYIDTVHNIAFIHILPLSGNFFGARCIDLPVGKSADLLHYYGLTLSADGSQLFATNGALGTISQIGVTGEDFFDFKVDASAHFNPGNLSMNDSDKIRILHNGAALSPDQKTLYFVGVHGIWAIHTASVSQKNSLIQGNYLADQTFTGLGLSADGRTLYAVDPAHGITLLNSSTGETLRVLQSPAHTPWGIEWIAH